MKWADLTLNQISAMLLEEEYRNNWNGLWYPLREKNKQSSPKPMILMAYALSVVAVWHAVSVDQKNLEDVKLEYLEDHYYLKPLFKTGAKSSEWSFLEYLAGASINNPAAKATTVVKKIRESYVGQPFQPKKPFGDLLNEIKAKGTFAKEFVSNLMDPLNELVPEEINLPPKTVRTEREKELEEKLKHLLNTLGPKPSCDAATPERARPDIKWDLNCTFAKNVCNLIEHEVKLLFFTGAPGTGKTYAAKLLARYYGAPLRPNTGSDGPEPQPYYKTVQFHPSYDYTDFVEGLRPIQSDEGMRFVKLDGSFKAFCRRVAERGDPNGKYFFIIDEINRADLSKVFGELMSRLEPDKQGPANRVDTQYQNLSTYDQNLKRELTQDEDIFSDAKGGFYVPENVYIIGTMNDIDRSVESMDFALRRRFTTKEAVVDTDMLLLAFHCMHFSGNEVQLTARVSALNDVIARDGAAYGLNRQYFISQGQFAGLPAPMKQKGYDAQLILKHVWDYRLDSLLREYLRGVDESRINTFVQNCRTAFLGEAASAAAEPTPNATAGADA